MTGLSEETGTGIDTENAWGRMIILYDHTVPKDVQQTIRGKHGKADN